MAGGQGSVLRRKKEQVGLPGFQLRAPTAAPRHQSSVDNQDVHGSPEPRDRAVMRVHENWCLEKGCPQECVRTGRRSSLDAPEPALPPKRGVLGGESAGAPRELEGTQEGRNRGDGQRAFSGRHNVSPAPVKIKRLSVANRPQLLTSLV